MAKFQPLVSIITPTYNQANYLEQAIDSVLCQNYKNIEYLVINDGSTDNTEQVLKKYNNKIKWFTQENQRENPTLNKAFSITNGQIIGKLSSDDYYYPGIIEEIVDSFCTFQDIVVAYPDFDVVDEKNNIIYTYSEEYDFIGAIRDHKCIPGVGAFFERRILSSINGLDTTFRRVADILFWWNAGLLGPFHHIPKTLGAFRVHSGSQTYQGGIISARETIGVTKKFFQNNSLPPEIQKNKNHAISSSYYIAGRYASQDQESKRFATGFYLKSLLTYPKILFSKQHRDQRNILLSNIIHPKVFTLARNIYHFAKKDQKNNK